MAKFSAKKCTKQHLPSLPFYVIFPWRPRQVRQMKQLYLGSFPDGFAAHFVNVNTALSQSELFNFSAIKPLYLNVLEQRLDCKKVGKFHGGCLQSGRRRFHDVNNQDKSDSSAPFKIFMHQNCRECRTVLWTTSTKFKSNFTIFRLENFF